jgi:hypothetical protein
MIMGGQRGHLARSNGGRRFPAGYVLVAALAAVAAAGLDASSSKFFRVTTQADFLKGEVDNLSIDDQGRLVLGPAAEVVYDTSTPVLWSAIAGSDGGIFVGTGNEGKVFRVDQQGNGSIFFAPAELETHALALAPDGGLYVATSPDGRIYRVDRSGRSTTFFDPDDKYIWALAVDAQGNLFAGTGPKGIVYKVTPDGKGARFCDTKTSHATSLAFDKTGTLYVGTASPGRILKVNSAGKAFVLLDSPYDEVHALHFDGKGMLYASALSGRPLTTGQAPVVDDRTPASVSDATRLPVPTVTTEITVVAVGDVSSSQGQATPAQARDARRQPRGAIYRIASDGLWDRLWESREDAPYDFVLAPDDALIVATGNKGKIYRLDGNPLRPTLLSRAGSQQITAFVEDGLGRLYYAGANPGKLYRFSTGRASRGTYESEPLDAQGVSTWGTLTWHATLGPGGRVDVSTRAGNTETPDDTWSPWSEPYPSSEGSTITSPKARYLQWRAILQGSGSVLTSLSAAYLPRNLRPQVSSITIHPPGIVFQKPFATGEPDLAGFEDQTTPDRKLTSAALSTPGSAPRSDGERTQRASKRSPGRPTMRMRMTSSTTSNTGAKETRIGRRCGVKRRTPFSSGTRPPFRTARISSE